MEQQGWMVRCRDLECKQQQDPETMMASQGDFKLTGYSSDAAMEDFENGVSTIKEGSMFDEGTEDMVCVISSELATYNNLKCW